MQIGREETGKAISDRLGYSIAELRPKPGLQECGGYFRTTCVEGMDIYVVATYNGKKFPVETVWERWSVTPFH